MPLFPIPHFKYVSGLLNVPEVSEDSLHTFWNHSVSTLVFLRDEQTVTLKYAKLFPSPLTRKLLLLPESRKLRLSCWVPNLLFSITFPDTEIVTRPITWSSQLASYQCDIQQRVIKDDS